MEINNKLIPQNFVGTIAEGLYKPVYFDSTGKNTAIIAASLGLIAVPAMLMLDSDDRTKKKIISLTDYGVVLRICCSPLMGKNSWIRFDRSSMLLLETPETNSRHIKTSVKRFSNRCKAKLTESTEVKH